MSRSACSILYVTFDSKDEAMDLARTVIQERLAACANLRGEGVSLYEWEGEMLETDEWVLLLKTSRDRLPALQARVIDLHEYTTPCVIAWDIQDGHPAFLEWVVEMSKP